MAGHRFDVLDIAKPITPAAAVNLARIVSKLSPMIGNLIEFNVAEILNRCPEFSGGRWVRQDPGFPDTIFEGGVTPTPGFEVKAWFPLATEITARFKDSQAHFVQDQTSVCVIAWLPEFLVFGKPKILDVCIVSGRSVAEARDAHYHQPPRYVVLEPGDTSTGTKNLQQTTTAGWRWQGKSDELRDAEDIVRTWGKDGAVYQTTPEYSARIRELTSRYSYRPDSNYAKIDRIKHGGIESFKTRVRSSEFLGRPISAWGSLMYGRDDEALESALKEALDVRGASPGEILQ